MKKSEVARETVARALGLQATQISDDTLVFGGLGKSDRQRLRMALATETDSVVIQGHENFTFGALAKILGE
jgi:hypothetical protein